MKRQNPPILIMCFASDSDELKRKWCVKIVSSDKETKTRVTKEGGCEVRCSDRRRPMLTINDERRLKRRTP
ncbi:hypothetical protein ACLOJK_037552 [Asimina triloba]